MQATERAPVKFPDSAPPSRNPLTGVLWLHGSPSSWLLLADSPLFPAYLSPPPSFIFIFFIETLAEACREIRLWSQEGSERNTIFTQQERSSRPWPPPQPWMGFSEAGCGSIEACGEVKADKRGWNGTDGGTYHDDDEFAFWKKEEGVGWVFCVQ